MEALYQQELCRAIDVRHGWWAVEATRKGNDLSGHYNGFQVDGFVVLDFRTNRPRVAHPLCPEIFHILWTARLLE